MDNMPKGAQDTEFEICNSQVMKVKKNAKYSSDCQVYGDMSVMEDC